MTRVLATRPHILLFDEADRALDHECYNLVFNLLARLARKTAMVLVSSDANITTLAQRHLVLQNGCLTTGGTRDTSSPSTTTEKIA